MAIAIKNLKINKKYYIRLRTYTKINGVAYVSKWSVKSKKIK